MFTPLSSSLDDIAKAVGRMVETTLILAAEDGLRAFWPLAVVLRAKLPRGARQGLAWALLMACDDGEVQDIAEAVLSPPEGAGWPLPAFDSVLEEAAFWAARASLEELRAYLLACFRALPPVEQAEFARFVNRRAAA